MPALLPFCWVGLVIILVVIFIVVKVTTQAKDKRK